MRPSNVVAILLIQAALTACAPHRSPPAPAPDFHVLTRTQLMSNHFQSAYDAVVALRANWLQGHSPQMPGGGVQVYLDDVRLGGIESLRAVSVQTVSYIRRQDSFEATARWGPGHGSGVIYLATHPVVWADREK